MNKKKTKSASNLGVAPNLESAGAKLGFAKEFMQELKNAGCPGFALRGSVDCDAVRAWLADNPEIAARWNGEGGVPPRAVSIAIRAHFDAKEAQRKHEEKIRKVISRERIAGIVAVVAEKQRAILKAYVSTEVLAKICEQMQPLFDECEK
jgi:hypothetical protein